MEAPYSFLTTLGAKNSDLAHIRGSKSPAEREEAERKEKMNVCLPAVGPRSSVLLQSLSVLSVLGLVFRKG